MRAVIEPSLDLDIYDHAAQDDPYPWYARLRAEAPVHHNTEFDYWVLSRHADVHWAVRDDATFSNAMGVTLDASAWSPYAHQTMSFLAMDPPEQVRLRRLVSQGFTPRRIGALAPRISQITEAHLEQCLEQESFDAITDLAGRVPMDVISEMLGVPEPDRDEVRRLADLLVHREDGLRDVPAVGVEAAMALFDYYDGLLAERRRRPADDLASALLAVEDDGEQMTDREITAFLFLMVVAGNETTTKLLGNALYHLGDDSAQRADVFADPGGSGLVDGWIEETLRFDTSTQFLARHVTRDFERHGRTVPAGAKLLIALGAANHDDAVFTDPESFDIRRPQEQLAQSLSFGGGRHFCLGANLARLEAKIVLDAVVRRVRTIDVHHDRAVRFYSANVRGFAELPVTVEAR